MEIYKKTWVSQVIKIGNGKCILIKHLETHSIVNESEVEDLPW